MGPERRSPPGPLRLFGCCRGPSDSRGCRFAGHECSDDAICTNLDGTYTCDCLPGFSGDGWECVDVDECRDVVQGQVTAIAPPGAGAGASLSPCVQSPPRAALRPATARALAVVVAMAAQALARVTLEEDELRVDASKLANGPGVKVETDTPIYSVVHVAVTPHRTVRLVAHGTCEQGLVLELRNTSYPPLLLAKILAAADAAAAAEAANGGGRAARVAAGAAGVGLAARVRAKPGGPHELDGGPPHADAPAVHRRVVRPLDLVICREAVHINHRHALLFPFQGLR